MPPSVNTSATAYATPSDAIARVDVNFLQGITSDDPMGEPTDIPDLQTNARLLAALLDASGMIEAACTVGERYLITDLQALTGATQGLLKRICVDLAVGLLWEARPSFGPMPQGYQRSLDALEALSTGKAVFGLTAQQLAGNMSDYVESLYDVQARQGPVVEACRFFSRRNDQWRTVGYGSPGGGCGGIGP